ncbi:hypothetical protein F4782DRAFT_413783 [Xylaria castorea]|nr:hypothetical protein F4782DRAFT_413783 [Xylaria castorea]
MRTNSRLHSGARRSLCTSRRIQATCKKLRRSVLMNMSTTPHRHIGVTEQVPRYCHRYRSVAAAAFDGMYLLVLISKADEKRTIQAAHCLVEGFIIPYTSPLLRCGLFRTTSQQQLRRSQSRQLFSNMLFASM